VFFSNRSGAYAGLSKYQEALSDAKECVRLRSDWWKGYSRKGTAEFHLGMLADSEGTFKKGLGLQPDEQSLKDGLAQVRLALAFKKAKEKDEEEKAPGGAGVGNGNANQSAQLAAEIKTLPGGKWECPACGEINKPDRENCHNCGKPKPPGIPSAPAQYDPPAEEAYQPDQGFFDGVAPPEDIYAYANEPPEETFEEPDPVLDEEALKVEEMLRQQEVVNRARKIEEDVDDMIAMAQQKQQGIEIPVAPAEAKPKKKKAKTKTVTGAEEKEEEMRKHEEKMARKLEQRKKEEEEARKKEDADKNIEEMIALARQKEQELLAKVNKPEEKPPPPPPKVQQAASPEEASSRMMRNAFQGIPGSKLKEVEREARKFEESRDRQRQEEKPSGEPMSRTRKKALEAKEDGNKALKEKRLPQAIKYYTEAIELDPTDAAFFSNRSGAYVGLLKYDEALTDAKECVRLKPDWWKGYSRKATAEFHLKRLSDCESSYKKGLAIQPEEQSLKDGLAQVRLAIAIGGMKGTKSKR